MCIGIEYIRQFPQPTKFDHSEELWENSYGEAFVVINCFSKNIYYPDHWTPLSVKCAFNGKENYRFSKKAYAVSDNSFLLLNEGNVYASYINADIEVESLSLNFNKNNIEMLKTIFQSTTDSLLEDPFVYAKGSLNFFDKLYEYTPTFLNYINLFRLELQQLKPDKNKLNELMYFSLIELVHLNKQTSSEIEEICAKKRSTREELYKRLNVAKDYISSCYQEDITLSELGNLCFLSPVYLLREFKRFFNVTPHQYLTCVRLGEATKLLSTTEKPISEIITEVGFSDISSFNRLFKRNFSYSPGAYRNITK